MARKKYISVRLSENFFNNFEKGRRDMQNSLGRINISQPEYSDLLADHIGKFKFKNRRR